MNLATEQLNMFTAETKWKVAAKNGHSVVCAKFWMLFWIKKFLTNPHSSPTRDYIHLNASFYFSDTYALYKSRRQIKPFLQPAC
jgi:hypothetical protein